MSWGLVLKRFDASKKEWRGGNHFYFGDFNEIPHAISYVEAASDDDLGAEDPHYSKQGYKYFVVVQGTLELEVEGERVTVGQRQTLMIEPGEVHRTVRLIQSPCVFVVFGTVKDPSGEDKVVVSSDT